MNCTVAMKYNMNLRIKTKRKVDILNFFMLLSMLLIGSEIWSIEIAGFPFRISFVVLAITMLLLAYKKHYKVSKQLLLFTFIIFFTFSAIASIDRFLSFVYVLYLLFSVFAVFYVFYSYIIFRGQKSFFKLLRKTLYIQAMLLVAQFFIELLLGYQIPFFSTGTHLGIPRPAIWFYETSFFATYFSFWLIMSYYMYFIKKQKDFLLDAGLSTVAIIFATATVGYLAIAFAVAFVMLIALKRGRLKLILQFMIISTIMAGLFFLFMPNVANLFVMRLFDANLNAATGGRIANNFISWEVFLRNPFFGVGPNAYWRYFNTARYHVPANITLELLATTGFFATILFYLFIFALLWEAYKASKLCRGRQRGYIIASILGIILFMTLLQVNQGYLRPYMWMLLGVLAGQTVYAKNIYRQKNNGRRVVR